MKVICINNKPYPNSVYPECAALLKEGQNYTVENKRGNGGLLLVELKHPYEERGASWNENRFIPLSDKDETEYADSVLEEIFITV